MCLTHLCMFLKALRRSFCTASEVPTWYKSNTSFCAYESFTVLLSVCIRKHGYPTRSMYASIYLMYGLLAFTLIFMVHKLGRYTIHGSYGHISYIHNVDIHNIQILSIFSVGPYHNQQNPIKRKLAKNWGHRTQKRVAFLSSKIEEIDRNENRNTCPTPWKINMEPENDGLEDDFPFQLGGF